MEQITRKSYGPFSIRGSGSNQPQEFFSMPWSAVKGANLIVSATDDIDSNPASAGVLRPELMIYAEVTIFGMIQGYATPLKTACIAGKMGPLDYTLAWEDGWDTIRVSQRLMSGGKPMTGLGSAAAQEAATVTMSLYVYVFPRGGFKEVTNG